MIKVGDEIIYIGPDGRKHSLMYGGPAGIIKGKSCSSFFLKNGARVFIPDKLWYKVVKPHLNKEKKDVRKTKSTKRKR